MRYIKEVFDVVTLEQAKNVVLTDDPTNPNKFDQETKFLIDIINGQNIITPESNVLDFGCGMGRVSRELVKNFSCNVIGVDISTSMLNFAKSYVNNPAKFTPLIRYTTPNSVDICISTFVLQHTENPKREISNIFNVIKTNGYFILVNELHRFIPDSVDNNNYIIWKDDNFNIFEEVESKFKKTRSIPYMDTGIDIIVYQKCEANCQNI
jgi:ubiquinone/menaquinone biosynthesis C-methylase UbiE